MPTLMGGDLQVLRLLNSNNLLMKIDGYAGWNTSANTIGTAIAEAVDAYHYKITKAHLDFLGQRLYRGYRILLAC